MSNSAQCLFPRWRRSHRFSFRQSRKTNHSKGVKQIEIKKKSKKVKMTYCHINLLRSEESDFVPANKLGILKFLRYFMINAQKLSNESRNETRFTLRRNDIRSCRRYFQLADSLLYLSDNSASPLAVLDDADVLILRYNRILLSKRLLISVAECRKGQDHCIKFGNDRAEKIFLISK